MTDSSVEWNACLHDLFDSGRLSGVCVLDTFGQVLFAWGHLKGHDNWNSALALLRFGDFNLLSCSFYSKTVTQ
jgi:hypothetical protein